MRTTNRDFDLYVKECKKWIDRFGLLDWRVEFSYQEKEKGARSSVTFFSENRVAILYLSPDWRGDKVTKERIEDSAFHEVLHLLLADFFSLAHTRFAHDDDELVKLEEAAIVRIVNAFGNR